MRFSPPYVLLALLLKEAHPSEFRQTLKLNDTHRCIQIQILPRAPALPDYGMNIWLEQDIATQLDLAAAWLSRTDGTSDDEWAKLKLYEDSGSSLRIPVRVAEERRDNRLRIVKLDPLTLTDGAASIEASLSPECHKSLRARQPHIPFTVRKYTLLYTPYGPPRHRVTFTLNSVDPDHRADTSKQPFGHLRPIHLCEDVVESALKLRQIRIESDRRCFGTVDCEGEAQDGMSPMDSPGKEASNEERYLDTQMAYGTQVAHRTRTPSKTTGHVTEPVHQVTRNDSRRTALLGLLNSRTAVAGPSTSDSTNESPRVDTDANQPSPGHSRLSNIILRPAAHGDAPKVPSAGGFPRTSTSRASNEGLAPPTDRLQSARLPPSYPRQNIDDKPPASVTTNSALENFEPEWLKDTCQADGCGRVPGPQQKLLSSWQKQRAGTNNRFPDANVPIQLFNAFRQFKLKATSSDSESSSDDGSSASNTNSPEEENIRDRGSTAHVASNEVDDLSDEEASTPGTPIPWSSSPVRQAPKAPFRPGHILPPDSSLPEHSTAIQRELQETSPVQEAQRVVALQSSGEENISGPHSSPPLVPEGDDSDMDMEMNLPRGLDEGSPARNIPPAATAVRKAAVVQVKETPYSKEKNPASPANVILAARAQQQDSSGTSNDTSSTSIVLGTYHESSSSIKSVSHGTDAVPSQLTALVPSWNDHEVNIEPVEVSMANANDEPPQPSLDFEDQRQHAHSPAPPLNPHEDLDPRLEPEQPRVEDGSSPLMSPSLSPVSGQRSHLGVESNVISHAKRKFEHSPSRRTRPSKRKLPRYDGFLGGERTEHTDYRNDLEEHRKAHFEQLTNKERTAFPVSLANYSSENRPNPGAQSTSSHGFHEANRGTEQGLEDLQTRSIFNANAMEREEHLASGHRDVDIDQTHPQTRESPPHSTGRAELQAPEYPSSEPLPQIPTPSFTLASEVPKGDDMEIDDAEAGDSDTGRRAEIDDVETGDRHTGRHVEIDDLETARMQNTEAHENITTQEVGGQYDSRHLQARLRTFDPPPRTAFSATKPKEVRPGMPSSKSATIFEVFKTRYPAYTGDMRHFLGQCKQMEKLDDQDKMVPKWQWDDFIIRNRSDYRDYANQCLDNGEDAEPYYRFYKDNLRDTLYKEGIIISRKTLAAAIGELEGGTAAKATAALRKDTVAKVFPSSSLDRRSDTEVSVGKSSAVKAPTAKMPGSRASGGKPAAVEGSSPIANMQRKARQSLPPAFSKQSGANTDTAQRPSKERPRQSLQAPPSRGPSPLPSSSSLDHSKPAKQSNRLSTCHSTSTSRRSMQRTSSGSCVSMEPTGDPYRDFVFAMGRAKSFTGNDKVRSASTPTPGGSKKNGG
ncbi:hypothetical protein PMIN06_000481 [Paraphaeosphaeria minitans]